MKVEQTPVCVSYTSQTVDKVQHNESKSVNVVHVRITDVLTYVYLLLVWVLVLFFLHDAGDECLPQLYIDINIYAYIVSLSGMV